MAGSLAVMTASAANVPAASHGRTNLVFILIDDMGYGDIGCMGGDVPTPHIDRLASEGVKFTDFYANAPVCSPTRCGFITGRWQQRVGFEWALGYTAEMQKRIDGAWQPHTDIHFGIGLPPGQPTIARMLQSAEYKTGAFGKWHLGADPESLPTRHGFDEYFGELFGHADYYRHVYYDGTPALRDGEQPVQREGYLTDLLNERATEFIHRHAHEPFFLYVPHLAVHAPFQPPDAPTTPLVTKETMLQGSRETYRAMLQRVDAGVGMILQALEQAGLADDTLIAFSSDNGGERYASNQPLFHHKATLWEGGIRVPCLMRWPARLPAGRVVSEPVITMDLTATFAAVADLKPPEGYQFDGVNLLSLASGDVEHLPERPLCWRIDRSNRQMRAIRVGDWKYLDDGGTMDLLFNLRQDPGERRNLVFEEPERVAQLKQKLTSWEVDMDRSPRTFVVH